MEFLNPAAFYGFFLLPLLLIPYLIKKRPPRFVFSSLLFFKGISSRTVGRPWGTLRLPFSFFLQLLLLVLLILALGEPVFSFRPLIKVALILDNSASMQALERRKSRFETARQEAADLVRSLSSRARVDLFVTVPRLERVGKEELTPGDAVALMSKLNPYDLGEPPRDYGGELVRLAREKGYERVFFFTDHTAQRQGGIVRVVSVGRPQENLAITSFEVGRLSFGTSSLVAKIEVTNFSSKEQRFKLLLKGGGKLLVSRASTVSPRRNTQLSFEGFPSHPFYEAELEVSDGLALDNRRFAVPPLGKAFGILGISPRPGALESLRSISGLNLKLLPPEGYRKSADEAHSLEIFHLSAPALLPQSHALFVLPPKGNPLVSSGSAVSRPVITSWREPHPLTRYVNFTLVQPAYAWPLKPLIFAEPIVESSQGPLVLALEQGGFRYLVLGFDPFPYLGRENLPVSIFTLNLLQWFYAGLGSGTSTGEPLELRPQHEGALLVTPKGESFPIRAASRSYDTTLYQGIYQVVKGEKREFVAVNFNDPRESDLSSSAPINLTEEPEASNSRSLLSPLWPYLLLFSLLLLILERFLNPPVTQP